MRLLSLFLVVVVAFVAGFAVRSQTAFVQSLGFTVSPEEASATASSKNLKSTYDSISARVEEVEDLLSDNSLDELDLEQATVSMLEAMLKATGDPYAAYFSPDRYSSYIKESSERSYAGIGVLFSEYNGRAYVADVFEGSEAAAKGVRQGDFVEAVDGDSSRQWTLTEVVNSLARDEGSSVIITWMRPISLDAEKGSEFTTTLVCQRYDVTNVTYELTGEVGYIRLRQITQNASDLVKAAVTDLTNQGATSFVLDIRDNPGGYLTQAVDIASLFVKSGVLVEIRTVDGVSSKTASGVTITDAPLVVLVNGYTSGAAEVLAAALQDNQRAEVVGQTTLGKGSVQVMRELTFGGAVRYTAAYCLSPLGHEINGVGVVPNIMVGTADDADTQRLVAVDTAHSLVTRG
ncbi:MAG: PDZ domain-containing protein [Eggerthellaceae bacterium]|nr:PDZ domain-containing protein [Eggerthellaceae bacterium]